MTLELIRWEDAHFEFEPGTDPGPDEYVNATVGWTSVEGKWTRIDSERTPDGPRAATWVPTTSIVERFVLERRPGVSLPSSG